MTDILELVLIIVAVWFLLNVTAVLWKRIRLYLRISALTRIGAEVKYVKLPFLSLFRTSSKPEITVKLGKKLYLIRIFSGGGIGKVVHFASAEFLVRFSRLRTAIYSKRRLGEKIVTARSGFAVGTKVFKIPALNTSEYADADTEVIPVLIFSPAPGEVSYVTEEKTSIRGAFTGDDVLGTMIFTSSTFGRAIEREYRREMHEAQTENEKEPALK